MSKEQKNTNTEAQFALQSVSGSCFWGHKWSKWMQYKQPIKTKLGEGYETRQRRFCLRCNKMQDEEV